MITSELDTPTTDTTSSTEAAAELSARFRPIFAHIAKGAASRDRDRELAHAEIAALKAEKFGAVRLPEALGGAGASVRQLFDLLIDLSAADSNVTQALRAHFFVAEGYILSGDARGLERVAAGEIIGNAISEKGAGSVDRYQTTLSRDGDRYLLNGTKFYSTGSLYADAIAVAADLDGERVYATVDTDAPGLTQFDDWDGFGQRLTGSGTSVYENVHVSAADVAPDGYGTEGRTASSAYLQLFHLAALAGILRRAADDVRDWVAGRTRTYSHAPADLPREDPLVQAVLGRAYSAAFVARATVLSVADALDAVLETAETAENPELLDKAELAAAEAQVALTPLVLGAITDLFDVGGASLSSESLGLDRHWRNARTLAVHNPVVYKQQAVGRFELIGDGLPYEWNAGVRGKAAETYRN
ncbi:MAG TPA: acyl-CoA dehydrogenase [Dietzia timorensis]|uniref:Dibenzothiophene monooxygenase n=1 Tax=Dietzia timorensis TaxID=499555 RepID=A0A921F1K8_9ACTN|nr:acyl-CoA dehydrogenase family protein [Dietzia timorensis]HJE90016.1 acyl-CoA dehydrogenase [Dietzia timorensis]